MGKTLLFVLLLTSVLMAATASSSYQQSIQEWQRQRLARLKADDGWLTVAGLFWLHEGDNEIPLPNGEKSIGSFRFAAGKTSFVPVKGTAGIELNGKTLSTSAAMQSDADGAKPDLLTYRDYAFFVIKRGERHAIRMRDKNSSMRREFTALHYYPIREDLRFDAKFVTYPEPKLVPVPNILNEIEQQKSIGYAVFTHQGQEYQLEPVIEGDQLFYIFKDKTAGKETYPSGRFVYSDFPKNGHVVLDFNKAYNPPCAFTPFATCPLPPKQNRLDIRIEAGELKYGNH
jgi:uncharacterized protein